MNAEMERDSRTGREARCCGNTVHLCRIFLCESVQIAEIQPYDHVAAFQRYLLLRLLSASIACV